MKACILLLAASLVSAAPKWHQLDGYTFDQYIRDFGKSYDASELSTRRALFEKRLTAHQIHNARNLTWKHGVNKFTDWTDSERRGLMGYDFARAAQRRHHNLGSFTPGTSELLSKHSKVNVQDLDSFSWISFGAMNGVTDQGQCGGCWAFASKTALESRAAIAANSQGVPTLSPQQLLSCAPDTHHCGGSGGCGGSTPELAYEYVKSTPLASEFVYSYASYTGQPTWNMSCPATVKGGVSVGGYVRVPTNNQDATLHALGGGPLAIAVMASTWVDYETGIYGGCDSAGAKDMDLDHAVTLTGIGSDANGAWWEIRNSWGAQWGEGGVIRLRRDVRRQPACYEDTTPLDGSGCLDPPSPPKVTVCGECGLLFDPVYPTDVQFS